MDVTLVLAAGALALVVSFFGRTRIPAAVVTTLLALAGAGIGWGGMLLQPDPSVGEFVVAVVLLTVLVPAHVRIVLGPFGPPRET